MGGEKSRAGGLAGAALPALPLQPPPPHPSTDLHYLIGTVLGMKRQQASRD